MNRRYQRSQKGNMFVLCICILAVIFIPILMFVCEVSPHFISRGRAGNVIEAAALVAANDLSRIVINDPYFGYVSLSNYPATGKATRAHDGESVPVTGINTIIGTIRQNAIIADELNNDTMKNLVAADSAALSQTIKRFNQKLSDCLNEDTVCGDADGYMVNPLEDARTFLTQNLPPNQEIKSLKLSLGWVESGGDTAVPVPQPFNLAKVPFNQMEDGNYAAYQNYPVGKRPFIFAAVGNNSHMVSNLKFQEMDDRHMCSIVKLECSLVSTDHLKAPTETVVCAQPYSRPDKSIHGAMVLRFAGRPLPGLLCWNDLITEANFDDHKVTTYHILDGDFPYSDRSRMKETAGAPTVTTAQQFSTTLYHWLRNGHAAPRLDAVIQMMNEPFHTALNEVYTYEFRDNGTIERKVMPLDRFTRAVVAQGQQMFVADTITKTGDSAIIIFRDNVNRISTGQSKHAGQPLAGYPLGNVEGNLNHEELALDFSRRDKHKTGLAVDIEIGGTGENTAERDILTMRERTKSRNI